MERTNIYLTEKQRDRLDERARANGMSRAELVRRMIDRALEGETDQLEADLAAIDGSFGALADTDWSSDRSDGARGEHLDRLSRQ